MGDVAGGVVRLELPPDAMLDLERALFRYRELMRRNGGRMHPALLRLYAEWALYSDWELSASLPKTATRLPKTRFVAPFSDGVSIEDAAKSLGVGVRRARDLAKYLEPRGEAYRAPTRGGPWMFYREAVERLAVARAVGRR